MKKFFLSSHVYHCITSDQVIFLNLRLNTYSALSIDAWKEVSASISGSTAKSEQQIASSIDSPVPPDLTELQVAGLVTDSCEAGRPATIVEIASPTESLEDQRVKSLSAIGIRHVIRFLKSYLRVQLLLRLRSIEYLVDRHRLRKYRSQNAAAKCDLVTAQELVSVYVRLRPLLPVPQAACLLDSLVLIEFLSNSNVYPELVFGVHARPFGAHCWVQHEQIVFNGFAERARAFTPILAV